MSLIAYNITGGGPKPQCVVCGIGSSPNETNDDAKMLDMHLRDASESTQLCVDFAIHRGCLLRVMNEGMRRKP